MSALTRPASAEDVARLWPAIKASRLMSSVEELARFRENAPWRLRVTGAGEALLLSPWRAHLGTLAIRGLWAAPHRIGALVNDACAIARSQGYPQVLSPLVPVSEIEPYRRAAMEPLEPIVALQGSAQDVAGHGLLGDAVVRPGLLAEIPALVELDAACFDEFWRYGVPEIDDSIRHERVAVAELGGVIVGYCACTVHGATATVGRLAVSPDVRRTGIGSRLLADAAAHAIRSHADLVTLCTQQENEASRALYRSCSLVELTEHYTLAARRA